MSLDFIMNKLLTKIFFLPVTFLFGECMARDEETQCDPANSFYGADELWRSGISIGGSVLFEEESMPKTKTR